MSVSEEHMETAFVVGGLFPRGGVELPPPKVSAFWRRREKWEVGMEGVQNIR